MPRDYFEPTSYDDDLFDAEEAKRRKARREAAKAARDAMAETEAKAAVILKARIDERARETNRRQVIAEYQAAGVLPLQIGRDGRPTVSLSMLLRFGWEVREISGKPTLIAPAGYRPPRAEPEPDIEFGAPRIEDDESENPAP